ncbi:MAG: hypothetical protein DA408_09865 [Bacteroidetes bacterium]|nr:MAG: hypothetical protein C7N36_11355 [Bacteroidota bacterium]PTM12596.1 MAG: hypothetical protein DA408_09865 [Bacteroidota bacterium]
MQWVPPLCGGKIIIFFFGKEKGRKSGNVEKWKRKAGTRKVKSPPLEEVARPGVPEEERRSKSEVAKISDRRRKGRNVLTHLYVGG